MEFYMLVLTYEDRDYFLYENNQFIGTLTPEGVSKQAEKFEKILGEENVTVEKYDYNTLINLVPHDNELLENPSLLEDFADDQGNSRQGYLIYE